MKLNEAARARLYAITALACAIWLVQNCVEANNNGDLFSWYNIVFILCLVVVTVYCGVSAVRGWTTKSSDSEQDGSEKGGQTH